MAYDEVLAERVRDLLQADLGYREQKMFGGLCFLLDGHMCAGVVGDRLMLRLGDEGAAAALSRPHVAAMDFTRGWSDVLARRPRTSARSRPRGG